MLPRKPQKQEVKSNSPLLPPPLTTGAQKHTVVEGGGVPHVFECEEFQGMFFFVLKRTLETYSVFVLFALFTNIEL